MEYKLATVNFENCLSLKYCNYSFLYKKQSNPKTDENE